MSTHTNILLKSKAFISLRVGWVEGIHIFYGMVMEKRLDVLDMNIYISIILRNVTI